MDGSERERLANHLEADVIQMVAGNLLRYDTARTLLESGRIGQAAELLERAVRTQREILNDLRRIEADLRPAPVSS